MQHGNNPIGFYRRLVSLGPVVIVSASLLWLCPISPSTAAPMPEASVLPWETLDLDPIIQSPLKQPLATARQSIANRLLSELTTLDAYAQGAGSDLTLNEQRYAQTILVGKRQNLPTTAQAISIQPIFCKLGEKYLTGINMSETISDLLLSGAYRSFTRLELMKAIDDEALDALISTRTNAALDAALNSLRSRAQQNQPQTHNLKLGMSLAKYSRDQNDGPFHCLRSLTAVQLSELTPVSNQIGSIHKAHMRRVLGLTLSDTPARPTRQLTIYWSAPRFNQWPLTFKTKIRKSEAVFGQPLPQGLAFDLVVEQGEDHTPTLTIPKELTSFIQIQKTTLDLASNPRVIHIYGRWAYLDKGRGYGLDMDDRLILQSDTDKTFIKGHVVGFYGPQMNLKNAAGELVPEGAILFVRTGLHQLKLGDALGFDPTSFPTDWPPSRTPKPQNQP